MTPDDRYHFEPLLMSVESAIARGETTGSYFHSEIRRLLRSAFDCGDHYIAGYKAANDGRPSVLDDSIDGNLQRVDALRVLELALASQGVPTVNGPSLLRDIEEGGYTLRLTTSDERRRRNMEHQ